jgi:hypothetical protein
LVKSQKEAIMMHLRMTMLALALGFPVTALAQPGLSLKPDTPTQIGTAEAVCTGVGSTARQNPAWKAYPLKIEVTGRGGQYLADVNLTLTQADQTIAAVHCDGPWLLFKLPPGRYRVEAEVGSRKEASSALVPVAGQGRIVLRFPDTGGNAGSSSAAVATSALAAAQSAATP